MTWEDAGSRLPGADYVVLPTGSTEQHSVHLPVSTDTLRAGTLSRELADAATDRDLDLVVLPTLPFGMSDHHRTFPGTVTIDPATYQDAVVDVGRSLAEHDVSRFLLLNCHGGNRASLSQAADRLQREHDLQTHFVHWTDYAREDLEAEFGEGWGHAGEHETSFVEYYYPDLVAADRKQPQNDDEMPETRSYRYFEEITELGGLGDPTQSDPGAMEEIVADATADILDALERDM